MFQNPLHPYVRGLRYLKILGLPLKFDEDEKGCMVVQDNRFIKCIILTAGNEIDFTLLQYLSLMPFSVSGPLAIQYIVYFATLFANGIFLKELYEYAPQYEITNWEINNIWFINIPASVAPIVYYTRLPLIRDAL